MEETQTTEGLPGAIKEIAELAKAGRGVQIQVIPVGDTSAAVAFLPGADGAVEAYGLVGELKAAAVLAKELRLEKADGPDRREGTASLQSLESFIAHGNRFKGVSSAVWADAANRRLVSVLDYHPQGHDSKPRWGRHRGLYACPLSEAWQAWGGGKALKLSQDAFAALLDSRDRELTAGSLPSGKAPDPAALITLANNLEVYSTATAKRERDPNTGRLKLSYSEDKGVSGSVSPPPSFLINIPVFVDSEATVLEVRLRVTVEEGHARFELQVHMASEVLRDAFDSLCSDVATATALPVFTGTPE